MADNDNTLGLLAHLLGLLAGFIGPLVIYLVGKDGKKDRNLENAKNALNWQISVIIYLVAGIVLMFVIVGILVLIALGILNIIFCIIGTVKASHGEVYRYPLAIPFIK